MLGKKDGEILKMNYLKIAKQITTEAHRGQKRKYNGEDYINHPRRVSEKFTTENLQLVAWLHDVLEDSDFTAKDLLDRGIKAEVIDVIKNLTRQEGENYFNFIMKIKDNYQARIVKIEDIKDNLINSREGSLKDKYMLSLYILETSVID